MKVINKILMVDLVKRAGHFQQTQLVLAAMV
jgi:hypothetical protein